MRLPSDRDPTPPSPFPWPHPSLVRRPTSAGSHTVPNEGYLDKSVHWKVRSGQIAFAEPTH